MLYSAYRSPRALHSFPTRRLPISMPPQGNGGLVQVSLDTGERRQLTEPQPYADSLPAVSPDGKRVAFIRSLSRSARELFMNATRLRSEEHTSELQSLRHLVCSIQPTAPHAPYTLSLHDVFRSPCRRRVTAGSCRFRSTQGSGAS